MSKTKISFQKDTSNYILISPAIVSICLNNFLIYIAVNEEGIDEYFKKKNQYQKDIETIKNEFNENISNEIKILLDIFPISDEAIEIKNENIENLEQKLKHIKNFLQYFEPFQTEQQKPKTWKKENF